jgi:hypothetical protein
MACERFADDLKAHAAGARATPDLGAHLEVCADCRADLARERRVVAAIDRDLAGALRLEPSVEFNARVRERINEDVGSGFSRILESVGGWRFALAAASLILVAGVLTIIALRTGAPQRQMPGSAVPPANTQASIAPAERPEAPAEHQDGLVAQPPVPVVAGEDGRRSALAGHRVASAGRLPTTDYRLLRRPKAEPEVLVPPDQRVAIARMLEMIRAGKIDERAFLPPAQSDVAEIPAQVVAPIVVEELKVPPISIPAAGSTEKRESR